MKKLFSPVLFMIKLLAIFSLVSSVYADNEVSTKLDDAGITAKITASYASDPLLSPFSIQIKTSDSVVYLSGVVDSDTQYEKAIRIAESTNNVDDVDTANLKVRNSQQPIKDTLITAKIKGKLIREAVFGDRDIDSVGVHVETKNGVVYLTGTVDNTDQKTNTLQVVNSVKGVRSVKDDLKIETNAG